MSSVDITSFLLSSAFATDSSRVDTEFDRARVLEEHPVAMGLVLPGSDLWSL